MSTKLASVEIISPDGREKSRIELDAQRLTVGRTVPGSEPDLALDPDPQRWVSRLHCMLEREAGTWWLVDNGTVNGTLLRQAGDDQPERVVGRIRLEDRDVILILGAMTDEGEPLYWQLNFSDPHKTQRAEVGVEQGGPYSGGTCLEYDWVQAKVYRRQDRKRTEVSGLRPKAHQLIRYMADKSRKNGGVPVACSHEELIRALWGEPEEWPKHSSYIRADLADVVADVRKQIEPDRRNPCVLQTERGLGYRLIVCEERN